MTKDEAENQAIKNAFILGFYYGKCTSGKFKTAWAVFSQLENFTMAAKAAEIAIEESEIEYKSCTLCGEQDESELMHSKPEGYYCPDCYEKRFK